jgi:hypothetical protein
VKEFCWLLPELFPEVLLFWVLLLPALLLVVFWGVMLAGAPLRPALMEDMMGPHKGRRSAGSHGYSVISAWRSH